MEGIRCVCLTDRRCGSGEAIIGLFGGFDYGVAKCA